MILWLKHIYYTSINHTFLMVVVKIIIFLYQCTKILLSSFPNIKCCLFKQKKKKCQMLIDGMCREGKIPDLSQADTSYYQVHKIQPITKHHVLLLDFAITTQKPTEICQVSCKNQSRINVRVSDDTSSLARVSDDTSNLAHVSDDISGPIRLWHVSPIRLRHMSLTHPQTPINRSLPKAFRGILRRDPEEGLKKG